MGEHEKPYQYPEIERLSQLENEKYRIEILLGKYISAEEVAEVSNQLFDWALELDDVARKIQENLAVKRELDYDGKIFSYKDPKRFGFFVSRDGLNFLQTLNQNNIGAFFGRSRQKNGKVEMFEWIQKNLVDIPKVRLENLQEGDSIALVDPETIKEIIESTKKREIKTKEEIPPPLPRDAFWDFYEEEMRRWKQSRDEPN